MNEGRLLNRVQAVLQFYNHLILATIQEYGLKSEPAFNNYRHISLQFDISVLTKSVIV